MPHQTLASMDLFSDPRVADARSAGEGHVVSENPATEEPLAAVRLQSRAEYDETVRRAMAVQDNDASTGAKPTVCVNMSSNFFGAGIAGQAGDGSWVRLRELSGTFNVTQAAPTTAVNAAELDDQQDNGNDATGTKYSISGTPQFGQAACPQP